MYKSKKRKTNHRPVLGEAVWLLHIVIQLHVQLVVQRIATITAQHAVDARP